MSWSGLGLTPPVRLYEEICDRYGEAHRAYHTLRHLAECFASFDRIRHFPLHPFEVEIALWFHDAIYDPRAVDSEEQSAAWASRSLAAAGAPASQAERVASLVLGTKHASSDGSLDQKILLDVDLSILGAPRPRFVEYESQVRQEYSFVPEEAFRKARSSILSRFFERPRIFATDYFSELLEARARANLEYSLERLGA